MKVLGVGFGRSGTMSLKQALEDLGAGPCLHMIDLIRNNELIPPWQEAAIEGNVDFDRMFEGFESTIDWPGCTYWKDLIEYYPDAPVLLNYRDFDGWYKSVNNTIVAVRKASMAGELKPDTNRPQPPPELWQVIGKLIYEVDFQGNVEDEAWMRDMYYARIEEIKRHRAGGAPDRVQARGQPGLGAAGGDARRRGARQGVPAPARHRRVQGRVRPAAAGQGLICREAAGSAGCARSPSGLPRRRGGAMVAPHGS